MELTIVGNFETGANVTTFRTRYGRIVAPFDLALRAVDAFAEMEMGDLCRKRHHGYLLAPLDGRPAHMYRIFQRRGGS